MDFLDIPDDVFGHHLFQFLDLNDLLRLRRVCKRTKFLAEDYIHHKTTQGHPWRSEIVIGPHDGTDVAFDNVQYKCMTLRSLLKLSVRFHLPTTRFFFLNADDGRGFTWWNLPLVTFLQRFARQVTHLRVSRMRAPRRLALRGNWFPVDFVVDNLGNLSHLTIDQLLVDMPESEFTLMDTIPSLTILRVKHLHVRQYVAPPQPQIGCISFWSMVSRSLHLESVSVPEYLNRLPEVGIAIQSSVWTNDAWCVGTEGVDTLLSILKKDMAGTLQVIDFERLPDRGNVHFPRYILELCAALDKKRIKILNARAEFFDLILDLHDLREGELKLENIGSCVVSLMGLNPYWLTFQMPYLEKIVLETRQSCYLETWGLLDEPSLCWKTLGIPKWPRLKIIDLTVNSTYMTDGNCIDNLYKLLFDVSRVKLTELALIFNKERDSYTEERREIRAHICNVPVISNGPLPPPSVKSITTNCFNLKKIAITAWIGTNKAISTLWAGLLSLEEITLESCPTLGNNGFVGEDPEAPTFLRLKGLKKLSLKSVDKMPKITDTLFKLILCNMGLREFCLTSSIPLASNGTNDRVLIRYSIADHSGRDRGALATKSLRINNREIFLSNLDPE